MSYVEMTAWAAYRAKHGSFNSMQRQEQMAAIIALQVHRLGAGKSDLLDFMPNAERPPVTLVQAMEEWV